MKIGALTSSRADYGIYQPLLNVLKKDGFFNLEIIAFGTHLSEIHGYTISHILKDSFTKVHKIKSLLEHDDEAAISESYGITVVKFAKFWNNNPFDLVLCLGDRFEMSAAVQASIPFGIKLAHIHGGETTLGAIDNIYRHQITIASKIHFASTKEYANKVSKLIDNDKHIFNVGALSLDSINDFKPIPKQVLLRDFQIEDKPFILCTFHPETVSASKNKDLANEMLKALTKIVKEINVVVTMPNADTFGSIFRESLTQLKFKNSKSVFLVENFGKNNYFSAMAYSEFLLGNTSSGIIEAASFKKYVVNVGDRQKGRAQSKNIINSEFIAEDIYDCVKKAFSLGEFKGENVYYRIGTAENIVNILKGLND